MTDKEAIESLKVHHDLYDGIGGDWSFCSNAISALEKQIPKKLLPDDRYFGFGKCPSCGAVFYSEPTPYCGNCGQKLE